MPESFDVTTNGHHVPPRFSLASWVKPMLWLAQSPQRWCRKNPSKCQSEHRLLASPRVAHNTCHHKVSCCVLHCKQDNVSIKIRFLTRSSVNAIFFALNQSYATFLFHLTSPSHARYIVHATQCSALYIYISTSGANGTNCPLKTTRLQNKKCFVNRFYIDFIILYMNYSML